MHVGDDGLPRLEALDPGERIVHTEMAWMRRITQTIDDPEIEAFQRAQLSRGMSLTSGV